MVNGNGPSVDVAASAAFSAGHSKANRQAWRASAPAAKVASARESEQAESANRRNYVRIPLAAELTGYSQKAIRRKIESGVWLEGQQYRRAPDGSILVSIRGYEQWVEQGRV
jgi:hypothetical protein